MKPNCILCIDHELYKIDNPLCIELKDKKTYISIIERSVYFCKCCNHIFEIIQDNGNEKPQIIGILPNLQENKNLYDNWINEQKRLGNSTTYSILNNGNIEKRKLIGLKV
jgi:hypothetical protein